MKSVRQPVRLGVVGTGMIGSVHAARVASNPRTELAVLASLDDGAHVLAEQFGVPLVADFGEVLAHDVDGVILATPNRHHHPMGMFFIEHGMPILIEKPIVDNASAGIELCLAGDQAGVPILVGHHRRHDPLVPVARGLVENRLGTLIGTSTLLALRKPDSYYEMDWRRQDSSGPLTVNLIHEIDLLRAICGEIVAVQSANRRLNRPWDFDDTAAILLHYEGGEVGTVFVSESTASPWSWESSAGDGLQFHRSGEDYLRVMGTEGSLAFPSMTIWSYASEGEPGWFTPLHSHATPVAREDPYTRQVEHFARVIMGEEDPLVSGWDGLRNVAVVEAVVEAGRTGSVVSIDPRSFPVRTRPGEGGPYSSSPAGEPTAVPS